MECELGERYEHKTALLKGLEDAAGNVGEQRCCGAAAERDDAPMWLDEGNEVSCLILNGGFVSIVRLAMLHLQAPDLCGGLAPAPQSPVH